MIPSEHYAKHLDFILKAAATYDEDAVEQIRTAVNRLLSELDRRDEDVDAGLTAIRALRRLSLFLQHLEPCPWTPEPGSRCTCGLLSRLDDYPNVWLSPGCRHRLGGIHK